MDRALASARALRWLGWARAAMLVAGLALCSVQATRYVPPGRLFNYGIHLGIAALFATLHLAAICAAATAAPLIVPREGERIERFENWLSARIAWIAPLFAFGSALLFAGLALDFFPKLPDEVGYLFQARTFAEGGLTTAPTLVPDAFDHYLITDAPDGRWAMPPPGWGALLSVGVALGVPYLVNPLLGALAVGLAFAVFRRAAGVRSAKGLVALLCLSPWFIEINASLMTHSVNLVLVLASWLALERIREGASPLLGLAAGLAMGASVLVRPVEGLVVGTMTGLFGLGLFAPRLPLTALFGYGIGCVAGGALFLVYNAHVTGEPFLFPMTVYPDAHWYPGVNALGFGPDIGNTPGWSALDPYPGHGLRDVLLNTSQNLYGLNVELFGWGFGSLLLAGVFVLRGRFESFDKRLAALMFALLAAYTLYWFSGGSDYGPRYWYLTILSLAWFTLRGAEIVGAAARESEPDAIAAQRLRLAFAAAAAIALFCFLPWRAIGKYDGYRGFHTQYRDLVRDHDLGGTLVLLRSHESSDWSSAFATMWPTPDSDAPVFARDLDDATARSLVAAFPQRPVVVVEGRNGPGERVRIVEGPLSPGTLPTWPRQFPPESSAKDPVPHP